MRWDAHKRRHIPPNTCDCSRVLLMWHSLIQDPKRNSFAPHSRQKYITRRHDEQQALHISALIRRRPRRPPYTSLSIHRSSFSNQKILVHQHDTIRSSAFNVLLDALPVELTLRLSQVLSNLSACKATESHAAQARRCWWVLVVKQTRHFASGPESWDGNVIGAENASVEVGLDSAISGGTC